MASTAPTFIVQDEQPDLEERKVILRNQSTNKTFTVTVTQDEATGQVQYENLPRELEIMVENFNQQEKWDNFKAVLECSVALHAAITVESSGAHQSIMRASHMVLEE